MRRVTITLLAAGAALALPACHKAQPPPAQDQNLLVENTIPANADIEELPADESDATPSNQLENGSDNPDVSGNTDNDE